MRHLRLLDPDSCPREGFLFTDPDTGYGVRGKTLAVLFANARLHRESNGLKIPADFEFQIETQICKLQPDRCVGRDGLPPDTSCTYRGEQLRWEGCDTCGGVRAKVMSCRLHGECSEFKHNVGVRQCGLCQDRQSAID